MSNLSFIPIDTPWVDFLISTSESPTIEQRMLSLGAKVVKKKGYTAYVWDRLIGDSFVSGHGIIDGQYITGPRTLKNTPTRFSAGSYVYVCLKENSADIVPDPFGMVKIYFGKTLVTNSLHLAAICEQKINIDNALTSTFNDGGFSFSLNTFNTPVSGISLVPAGSSLTVKEKNIVISTPDQDDDYDSLDPSSYWELIYKGAQEVSDNLNAVLDSSLPVYLDLSGGRDSRVVFGALIALGRQKDVIFNTIANPSNEGLRADLNIASGLVKYYGGSYSDRPRTVGYSAYSTHDHLMRRRSQVFGTYHWIVPSDVRGLGTLTKTPSIRVLGGGGELYREYWRPLLFTSAIPKEDPSPQNFLNLLMKHRGARTGRWYFERYVNDLLETFEKLPGRTLGDKLDAHYLHFRNRYHFGPRQSLSESLVALNIATVPSLLKASRGLPPEDRASGRVLFDVIRAFDEKLAFFEFDKPNDPKIFDSQYHRKSEYGSTSLEITPAPEIVSRGSLIKGLSPKQPTLSEPSFEEILDSEIFAAFDDLKNSAPTFSFIANKEMEEFIDWAIKFSPRNRSAIASKLRSFADYSQFHA
ncbi:hypothetical protein [Boudabousia liubingyangii]|uniref:hypothetical protein n=1 Tax=Boudabousia liubingyangii TaxID=1921764 RepID=UPI000AFDD962|nr:hypothetical protein [Boudabousia liubingyangii]